MLRDENERPPKTDNNLPPHSEELKESYNIYSMMAEHSIQAFQLGSDRRANDVRQRLDHGNYICLL